MIVKTDRETIGSYFEDSSNVKGGWADEVVLPERPEDVSSFLSRASREKMPVSISGGGTGTTGARVPFGGAVLSLERLNRIIEITRLPGGGGVGRAQAGALVDDFMRAANAKGLFYTCHPTEKTATLGGTVATNASGARSFRYGSTRKFVRSLDIILATGEALRLVRGERVLRKGGLRIVLGSGKSVEIPLPSYTMPSVKNAAGYFAEEGMDPIDLFIGQEGTLAVVVGMELDLAAKFEEIFSCVAFFPGEEASWGFAEEAKALAPLSIEYFDRNALNLLRERHVNMPGGARAAIFFEKECEPGSAATAIEPWQDLLKRYHVPEEEVWAAMTEREAERFIELRHAIPSTINETIRTRGFQKVSTDCAVPSGRSREMMNFYAECFKADPLEHVIFGHIGENHVHVNILPRSEPELARAKAHALAFARKAIALGGTVSAEHGIGKIKHAYLEALYGRRGIVEMARIKKALDPACILGPDNIFPKELLSTI